jgi:hypothetical protein
MRPTQIPFLTFLRPTQIPKIQKSRPTRAAHTCILVYREWPPRGDYMCTFVCVCVCVCVCTCVRACIMCVCVCVCAYVLVHLTKPTSRHAPTNNRLSDRGYAVAHTTYVCACMHVCMHGCMCVCVCMCIFVDGATSLDYTTQYWSLNYLWIESVSFSETKCKM